MHTSLTMNRGAVARARSRGFGLIEMMVVVVIFAILAAAAYPSYTRHVQKTRRSDATLLLSMTAQRLERCHAECNAYTAGSCASACPTLPLTSTDGYYQISSADSSISAHAFTLVAKPVGTKSQANDSQCATFSLDQLKQKGALNSSGADATAVCWSY